MAVDPTFVLVAFLLGYGAYLDITNDRTIPNRVAYLSLLASLLLYIVKLALGLASLDGLVIASATFAILYVAFRLGLMGEAEAFYTALVVLHYPYAKLFSLPLPSPFALYLYASIAFAFYLLLKASWKGKKDWRYLLLIPLYAIFALNVSLIFPIPWEVHVLFLLTVLVGLLSPSLKEGFISHVPIERAEGEIPVEGPRVLLAHHVEEMKEKGIREVKVYRYPPFLPFLFLSFLYLSIFNLWA